MLQPFRFEPSHQPFDHRVAFTLAPLDQRAAYMVNASRAASGGFPDWDTVEHVLLNFVQGWEGIEPAHSRAAIRDVLTAQADPHWQSWLVEIVGTLYRRSLLGDTETKN